MSSKNSKPKSTSGQVVGPAQVTLGDLLAELKAIRSLLAKQVELLERIAPAPFERL